MISELKSSRPVYYESDVEGFDYWMGGTSFVVDAVGELIIVTARHVGKKTSLADIRIPVLEREREFFPVCNRFWGRGDLDDSTYSDVAVLRYDESCLQTERAQIPALAHDPSWRIAASLRSGTRLVCRGFPLTRREIKYEERKIADRDAVEAGQFDSTKPRYQHCGFMRFDDGEVLRDDPELSGNGNTINGMSGSPVFADLPRGLEFVGMLVMGSTSAGGCYFIERPVIDKIIREALGPGL